MIGDGLGRRLRGDFEEDEWGLDPGYAGAVQPLLDLLHDRWWRVAATGTANVPATGSGLVLANGAGGLPHDTLMIATTIARAWSAAGVPAARRPRLLVPERAFTVPFAVSLRRLGGVPASPQNARRLLGQGEVAVATIGGSGLSPRSERGGLIAAAIGAGAALVPCAVLGPQEALPGTAWASKMPRVPLPLRPFGLLPPPVRWQIGFGEPIDLAALPAGAVSDRRLALELAEEIDARTRALLREHHVNRAGAFA